MKIVDEKNFREVVRNSKTMREAANKLNMHYNTFTRWAKKFGCYAPNQGGKGTRKYKSTTIKTEDILAGKYPNYQTYKLKKRLIREGYLEDKCSRCGWCEKRDGEEFTPCELHHRDGDSTNHRLENLDLICPNCHSLTETYRAKNKKD